ncbi:ABC transporter ATP-binding protein [Erysipelotrichaceae bacterium 51-3]
MELLKIENLSKAFKNHQVLNGLNLCVNAGDLIHIRGQNGCGKSTLFKLICGLEKTDSGTISLTEGVDKGALIENPGFIENENLTANLEYLYSLKHSVNRKVIRDYIEAFGLDPDSKTKMKDYSVGMRQKAGIIQAIMEDQNLILLDEPSRGLDEESLLVLEKIILKSIQEQKAIIIASHDSLDNLPFSRKLRLENGQLYDDCN